MYVCRNCTNPNLTYPTLTLPFQAMNTLHNIYPDTKSKEFAHSTSPTVYKLWTYISSTIQTPPQSHSSSSSSSSSKVGIYSYTHTYIHTYIHIYHTYEQSG